MKKQYSEAEIRDIKHGLFCEVCKYDKCFCGCEPDECAINYMNHVEADHE